MNIKTETTIIPGEVVAAGQQNVASEAQQALVLAEAFIIDSPEMYEAAANELRDIKGKYDRIEAARLNITRPIDASKKAVMDFFRSPLEKLEKAGKLIKASMLTYQQAEQKKADDARREAEAKAQAEQRALEAAQRETEQQLEGALQSGNVEAYAVACEAVETIREQRELAEVAPTRMVIGAAPKAKGTSTRDNWQAEVFDFKAFVIEAAKRAEAGDEFLLSMLEANMSALNTAAKSMKQHLSFPGIRAVNNQSIAVRAK